MLELDLTIDLSVESIVRADAYVYAGMNVSTSLSHDDVACNNRLSVSLLDTESLGFAVAAILGGTNTLLVSKEL